jgi:hypothetical protein
MARAFDGPELALRRLFGKGGPPVMDISIEAGVARALISVNGAVCGAAHSHQ